MDWFEIRLESIGGLGAHLAGQILAEAGVLGMGLSGAQFSSYGSEKKRTPIKSFIRLGPPEAKIRTTSAIRQPDLVAVFHEELLSYPGVLSGLRPGATLVVNTASTALEIAERVWLPGVRVVTVDAVNIVVQENTRINTAMLGAVAGVTPLLEPEAIRRVIADTFGKKYPHLVAANLRTFDRGFSETDTWEIPAGLEPLSRSPRTAGGPVVGYRSAPMGGLLPSTGNCVQRNLSASRQGYLPVFHAELCAHCGVCDLVCPDFCLVWEASGQVVNGHAAVKLAGIDYQYCKGCMHCVEECPTGALTTERETAGLAARLRVPLAHAGRVAALEGR